MAFCYPSSPRKLAMTVAFFASGAALFAIGIHFSYLNVAPQQARTKARNDFVKERLRQKQGLKPVLVGKAIRRERSGNQIVAIINVDQLNMFLTFPNPQDSLRADLTRIVGSIMLCQIAWLTNTGFTYDLRNLSIVCSALILLILFLFAWFGF